MTPKSSPSSRVTTFEGTSFVNQLLYSACCFVHTCWRKQISNMQAILGLINLLLTRFVLPVSLKSPLKMFWMMCVPRNSFANIAAEAIGTTSRAALRSASNGAATTPATCRGRNPHGHMELALANYSHMAVPRTDLFGPQFYPNNSEDNFFSVSPST